MEIEYSFNLSEGCEVDIVNALERDVGFMLPDDYRQFLSNTNGVGLSGHTSSRFCTIEEIYSIRSLSWTYSKEFLAVGTCADSTMHIALKGEGSKADNNIYVIDVMAERNFRCLNCSFIDFFNKFIMSYGSVFWDWV